MENNPLKKSVERIVMPEPMKARIIAHIASEASKSGKYRNTAAWGKPVIAAAILLLCFSVAIPVGVADSDTVYGLMYFVSPEIAQFFHPVQKSDIDNGIKMEVVSCYIHGDTAEIYIAMQDLTGDRIDETIDLYDSYSILAPFDSSAHCERAGYDENTKTATFLITIQNMNGKDLKNILGDKVTFTVRQFLSRKKIYKGVKIPYDFTSASQAEITQQVNPTGGGGLAYADTDTLTVLVPGEPYTGFPIEGVSLTGIGFIDGKLHIQTAVKDPLNNDNHGFMYLADKEGNRLEGEANYYFITQNGDIRVDYQEEIFPVTPEELLKYELYGEFYVSDLMTNGKWDVTFPLK